MVLVRDSSLGIGRETAIQFAKKGARVGVTYYKDRKEGEKTMQELLCGKRIKELYERVVPWDVKRMI